MGRHADAGRSRGVARWVITAAAVVIVLAAVTVIYVVVVNRSDRAVDGVCAGKVSLSVLTGPGAKPALAAAADAYNRTGPVARSSCVTATISAAADADALTALSDPSTRWPSGLGPAPGMWVPDNAATLAALDDVQPAVAAGHPTDPFAWSPVVLAVRTADVPAVSDLTWSDLPAAAGPTGTAALPGARHLLLALPPVDANRATSYAAQSLLAGTDRSDALDISAVQSQSSVLTAFGAGAAGTAATTTAALNSLGSGGNQATGSVTAVPVVEADLAAFDASGHDLAAVHPAGPTVGDSLITAPITAGWTDPTVAAAASSFQAYLSSKPGQQILADHGWRTDSVHPSDPIAGVDTTASVRRLPPGSANPPRRRRPASHPPRLPPARHRPPSPAHRHPPPPAAHPPVPAAPGPRRPPTPAAPDVPAAPQRPPPAARPPAATPPPAVRC